MPRHRCPRCRGTLFFTAEDELPRFTCLQCSRSFAPAHQPRQSLQAA